MGRPQTISTEDMLAAAREVFMKYGAAGSTREIARKAGISEAALFKRFSTKAQLFMAAMVPPAPAIDGIMAKAAKAKSAQAGLEQVAEGFLEYFRTALPMILPMAASPAFIEPGLPKNFATSPATALLDALTGYLRGEQKRGRIHTEDPYAVAATLVAALHSVALFELMGFHGGATPRAGIRAVVRALWGGLEPSKHKGK
jgi:AcrR family transcriptional regulator